MRTFVYKTVDGHHIKADILGSAAPLKPKPVVVWIHGGALILGNRQGSPPEPLTRRMTEAGFIIVSIDYRLAPETKVPEIIEDVKSAFAWVRDEGPALFGADPGRICTAGESAGGYLTLMSGLVVRPRPNALVSFYGYGDIAGDWYGKPDPFYCGLPPVAKEDAWRQVNKGVVSEPPRDVNRGLFYLYCRQCGLWPKEVCGLDPETERARFTPYCPEQNVTSDFPPTMLLHGVKDTDVPYYLSERMAAALEKAGVEHEFISLQKAGHGFASNSAGNYLTEFDRAVTFLASHVLRRSR